MLLEDITVVALEQAVAAPLASRHLADWGAKVIKIERPGSGDFARGYDKAVKGLSSHFVWLNRSKKSVTLNIKTPEGKEVLSRLLSEADVFIQNLAPGAVDRLGFGSASLLEINPRLIICNITGYGNSGPYRDKKAYDLMIQAEAGLLSITGTEETPSKAGISIADIAAGMYAYSGVLAALFRRAKTGKGAVVEVSLFDALVEWMSYPLYFAGYGGEPPARTGANHATIAPYGPITLGGGESVVIGLQNEREWGEFCQKVLQRSDLVDDCRFMGNHARNENRGTLDGILLAELGEISVDDVIQRLEGARIAYGRINTMKSVFEHKQLIQRNRWTSAETPSGSIDFLRPPVDLSDETAFIDSVPSVGEHTEETLVALGYAAQQIDNMRNTGVV